MEPGFEFWKQVMSSRPVIGGELDTWPQHSPLIGSGDEQHAEPLPAAGGEDDHPHHLGGVLQPLQTPPHREGESHQHQQGPFIISIQCCQGSHTLLGCHLHAAEHRYAKEANTAWYRYENMNRQLLCHKLNFLVQVKRGHAWKVVGWWLPQRQELGTQWGKILALHTWT